jgi:sialate O-acetylesterase
MVLQRNQPIRIHGNADPGRSVEVSLGMSKDSVITNSEGEWEVTFPPMRAGGPHRIVVRGDKRVILDDVMVGDVWLASGQSNMAATLGDERGAAIPSHPKVRIFTSFAAPHVEEQDDLAGEWEVCRAGTHASSFTAVGYYFATRIHEELGVPIGIIHSSKGGTHIEEWLPLEVYLKVGADAERRHADMEKRLPEVKPQWDAYFTEAAAFNKRAYDGAKVRRKDRPKGPVLPVYGNYKKWPTICHNAYVHPLLGHALQGIIWYQGESNAGIFGWKQPAGYHAKFAALIDFWRESWRNEDMPVYFVQLPNLRRGDAPRSDSPAPDGWTHVRMEQLRTWWRVPDTGMVVTIDIGGSLHPAAELKKPLANRLAAFALAHAYDRTDAVYAGPAPRKAVLEDGRIRISFEHAGGGLMDRNGGELQGFAVEYQAMEGGRIRSMLSKAPATIDGRDVIVDAAGFQDITGVAYAHARNPVCDLFSKQGLPASPFVIQTPFER